jgi:hypothetical protein
MKFSVIFHHFFHHNCHRGSDRNVGERGVVIFDPRKLYINIIGTDQIGNTIIRYNEEILGYVMPYGVRVSNIIQKLRAQHPQVDKWEYRVSND